MIAKKNCSGFDGSCPEYSQHDYNDPHLCWWFFHECRLMDQQCEYYTKKIVLEKSGKKSAA
jgi:hypothetical protein